MKSKPTRLQGNGLDGLQKNVLGSDLDDEENETDSEPASPLAYRQITRGYEENDSEPEPPQMPRRRLPPREDTRSSGSEPPDFNRRTPVPRKDARSSGSESANLNRLRISDDAGSNRLVIAIDYGTTFTGACYAVVPVYLLTTKGVAFATPKSGNAGLREVEVVRDWGPQMSNSSKIPSVISYTHSIHDQQWGASISEDAVTMLNTKMELDVLDNKLDELELILQVLEGTCNLDFDNVKKCHGYPEYTGNEPEDVVLCLLTFPKAKPEGKL